MKLLVFLLTLVVSQTASPIGEWRWKGLDDTQQIVLLLRTDGGKLTGSIRLGQYVLRGPAPGRASHETLEFKLANVRADGGSLTFDQIVAEPRQITVRYHGTIADDVMTLTRELRGNRQSRLEDSAVTFTLERVK